MGPYIQAAEKALDAKNADPTKFVAKKSKAVAKAGTAVGTDG